MATAATVTIRLDADSATLVRELQKAENASKTTFGNIQAQAGAMAAAGAAAAAAVAAAAVAALGALAKASFDSIDALAKTADRLNIATESMRTFQVAADLAGVSQEKLEKALFKQQKAVVDAVDGQKEMAEAFAQLGLNAREVINLPVDQQFAVIADALDGVGNASRRNAIALQVFGKGGMEIINLAQQGTGGLVGMRKALDDMNVTVSRLDAAKIEQANDAVSMAKLAFEGVGNSIAVAVAPIVQGLADDFLEAARATGGFRDQVETAMTVTVRIIGGVADVLAIAQGALRAMIRTVGEFLLSIPGVRSAFEGLQKVVADFAAKAAQAGAGSMEQLARAFDVDLPSAAIDRWLAEAQTKSEAAAAEMAARMKEAVGGGGADAGPVDLTPLDIKFGPVKRDPIAQPRILDRIEALPPGLIEAEFTRQQTQIATQQYLEAWQLANEQRLIADQALKDTLFASDQVAGQALIELAAQQAREKVLAEFEARGEALDETGQIADPKARAEFEQAVQDETLAREKAFLDQRLAMQQRFGTQYMQVQSLVQGLFGKTWAATHTKALQNVSAFAGAALQIGATLFGGNKKLAAANALISTYAGVAKALELPFPANIAAAAQVLATGLAQVRGINQTTPGGGTAGGAIGGALGGQPLAAQAPLSQSERASQGQSSVQVVFQGDVNGWDRYVEDRVIGAIREAVNERDVILIDPRSRNARDLVDA